MKEAAVTPDGLVYADVVRHLFGLGEEDEAVTRPPALVHGRPLPLVVPTAFVRIRPRGSSRVRRPGDAHRPAAAVLLRVGSRGSRLALTQAERAADALRRPGVEIALVPITTAGDRDRTRPFGEIGSRGVFVKELEEALLEGRIDVAVHSAKDMTSTDIGRARRRRVPARARIRAMRSAERRRSAPGMRIGTASARRRAQLLALEPTLSVEPLRGNIDTRLRKRGERGLDAIVLAACGLDRLGLAAEIGARLDPEVMLPEAGQGALALQVRAGEEHLVAAADDPETRRRVEAERRCVAAVGGRLPCPGRRPPRRGGADRARRRRGRQLARAARGRRSRGARARARGARPVSERRRLACRAVCLGGVCPSRRPRAARRSKDRPARHRTGTQPAQTRRRFALTVRIPVGGRGLGMGRRGDVLSSSESLRQTVGRRFDADTRAVASTDVRRETPAGRGSAQRHAPRTAPGQPDDVRLVR